MTNHSEEQENSRLSRSREVVCFLVAALGYILIVTSLVLFTFAIFVLFTENSNLAIRSATTATVMLIFGMILVLLVHIHLKRGSKTSAVQVVISTIPAEDLTKSPVPTLSYYHTPRRQSFDGASSIHLPDYFTAVQDSNEVYSSVNAAVCTDDFSEPFAPPPSYEEALKMASITSQENKLHSLSQSGDGENIKLCRIFK